MPSSITFATSTTTKGTNHSIYARPPKKPKMSITQTYFLAHSARGKLSREAARPDHDLRLLVGHANMLDSLMLDLANAEQEQERWFNQSVSGAHEEEETVSTHINTIIEEPESDWEAEDAESESDSEDELVKPTLHIQTTDIDMDMEDEDESDEELALTRTPSRHSPPALSADSDSEDEDEHMPPSPPQPTLVLTEKEREAIATTSFYDTKTSLSPVEAETFQHEGFYLPSRQQPTIIAAY